MNGATAAFNLLGLCLRNGYGDEIDLLDAWAASGTVHPSTGTLLLTTAVHPLLPLPGWSPRRRSNYQRGGQAKAATTAAVPSSPHITPAKVAQVLRFLSL